MTPNEEQGLGLFARWGWADDDAAELDCFWSVGLQYRGLIELRDDDVLGVGFASGQFAGSDSLAGLEGIGTRGGSLLQRGGRAVAELQPGRPIHRRPRRRVGRG